MALLEADFTDIKVSASFDSFSSSADVAFLHGFISEWFFSPMVIAALTNVGLATPDQIELWKTCCTTGSKSPAHPGNRLRRSRRR